MCVPLASELCTICASWANWKMAPTAMKPAPDHHPLVEPEAARQAGGQEAAEEHGEEGRDADDAAVDGLEPGAAEGGVGDAQRHVAEHEQQHLAGEQPDQAGPPGDLAALSLHDGGAVARRRGRAGRAARPAPEPGAAAWPWTSPRV